MKSKKKSIRLLKSKVLKNRKEKLKRSHAKLKKSHKSKLKKSHKSKLKKSRKSKLKKSRKSKLKKSRKPKLKKSKKRHSKHNKQSGKIKSKKLKKRKYNFDFSPSNYFESLTPFPLIKSEQESELEWRRKMFVESPNDLPLHETYPTILPLEHPNSKNLLDYAVDNSNLTTENNCSFIVKDFKHPTPNFKFLTGDDVTDRNNFFKGNLELFSDNLFGEDFDWNCQGHGKVVIAGGCVNTCAIEADWTSNINHLLVQDEPGDIDLFLVNSVNIEKQVDYLIQYITAKRKSNILMRTKNAITIVGFKPYRHVQIVLRKYTSVQQLLCGFDIDSCCFAYDGKDVITNRRGYRSVIFGSNVLDPYTASKNGVKRLIKYMNRGFPIFLPFSSEELDGKLGRYVYDSGLLVNTGTKYIEKIEFLIRPMSIMHSFTQVALRLGIFELLNYLLKYNYVKEHIEDDPEIRLFSTIRKNIQTCNNFFTLGDYGYCQIGDSIDCDLQQQRTNMQVLNIYYRNKKDKENNKPSVLLGAEDVVMSRVDLIPLSFMKNGSGNQEFGSIRPIDPKLLSLNYLWNFGELTPEFIYKLYGPNSIFLEIYKLFHSVMKMNEDGEYITTPDIIKKSEQKIIKLISIIRTKVFIPKKGGKELGKFNVFNYTSFHNKYPLLYTLKYLQRTCKQIARGYNLYQPLKSSFIEIIKAFIKNCANVNQTTEYSVQTPLNMLSRLSLYDQDIFNLIQFFLEKGADVNLVGEPTAPSHSRRRRRRERNTWLKNVYLTPLEFLVKHVREVTPRNYNTVEIHAIMKLYKRFGADFTIGHPVLNVFRNVNGLEGSLGEFPKLVLIKDLVNYGADINKSEKKVGYPEYPLELAVKNTMAKLVELMLKLKADPNLYYYLSNKKFSLLGIPIGIISNSEPPHPATIKSCKKIFDLLVNYGISVNKGNPLNTLINISRSDVRYSMDSLKSETFKYMKEKIVNHPSFNVNEVFSDPELGSIHNSWVAFSKMTYLIQSVLNNDEFTLKLLLEKDNLKLETLQVKYMRKTAIEFAFSKKDKSIFKLLDAYYKSNGIELPLLIKLTSGTEQEIKSYINSLSQSELNSALNDAIQANLMENNIIEELLEKGAIIDFSKVLPQLIIDDNTEMMAYLLTVGDIDLSKITEDQNRELKNILIQRGRVTDEMKELLESYGLELKEKTDYKECGNKIEGTLMGYSLKDDIPPEDIIKLNDGNCEDINYFKDAAEAGSRSVVINPYTGQELTNEEKHKIIHKFKLNGVKTFTRNGSEVDIDDLFLLSNEDLNRGRVEDDATLGFFRDANTNVFIASRDEGLYNTMGELLGVINSWDQETRTLRDIDNNILLTIEDDYRGVLPDGYYVDELSPQEKEDYERRMQDRQAQRMAQFRAQGGQIGDEGGDELHLSPISREEDELDLHPPPPQLSPVQSVASAEGSEIPNLDDSDLEFDEPIPDSPDLSLEEGEILELASIQNSARRRLDFDDLEEID